MKSNSRVLRGWRDFGVKATAIILTILLATQMVGTPAFATATMSNKQASEDIATTVDDTGVELSGTEATDTTVPDEAAGAANEPAPADSTQATEEPVAETAESATEPATETPAADPAANAVSGTEPEPAPAPAVEQDQLASIELNLADGASITLSKDGNKIDDDTNPVDVPANEELKFTAAAPEGMQVSAVRTAIDSVESDPIAADENGEYTIAAEDVTDELTVKVETSAAPAESQSADECGASNISANDGSTLAMPNSLPVREASWDQYAVTVVLLGADGQPDQTAEATIGGGVIADQIETLSVEGLSIEGYDYVNAKVGNEATTAENVIAFAGGRNSTTYYSADPESIVASALQQGESIFLYFEPHVDRYAVTYNVTGADGQAGNTYSGPAEVRAGDALSFTIDCAYGYTVEASIGGKALEANESGVYAVENIQSNTQVDIAFSKNETIDFIVDYTTNEARWHGTTLTPKGRNDITAGSDFSFTLETRRNYGGADYWRFDSLELNGVTISLPRSYEEGAFATTTLPNGVVVNVELTDVEDGHWGPLGVIWYEDDPVYNYTVTVFNAYEDIHLTNINFCGNEHSEVIPHFDSDAVTVTWTNPSDDPDKNNGTAINEGPVQTRDFGYVDFVFQVKPGYRLLDVKLDGVSKGAVSTLRVYDSSSTIQHLDIETEVVSYGVKYDPARENAQVPTDGGTYAINGQTNIVVGSAPTNYKGDKIFLGWKLGEDVYMPGDVVALSKAAAGAENGTITFIAQWGDSLPQGEKIPLMINVCLQNSNSGYDLSNTVGASGFVGTQVSVLNPEQYVPDGCENCYKLNGDTSNTTLTPGNESGTEFNLYFDRVMKDVSYSVEYYKDGVKVESDSYTKTQPVWVHDNTDSIAIQEEIDASGNKYEGYSLDRTDPEELPSIGTSVKSGSVYKVYYVAKSYDVTYEFVSGTAGEDHLPSAGMPDAPEKDTVEYGDPVGLPSDYETVTDARGVWEFQGWRISGTEEILESYKMPAKDVMLEGVWQLKADSSADYTVSYQMVSADADEALPAELAARAPEDEATYKYGQTVTIAGADTSDFTDARGVWEFQGWTVSPSSEVSEGQFSMPAGNATVTGTWQLKADSSADYTVSYQFASDTASEPVLPADMPDLPEADTAKYGQTVTIDPADYEDVTDGRGTWEFLGWTVAGSEEYVTEFAMPVDGTTVTGHWQLAVVNIGSDLIDVSMPSDSSYNGADQTWAPTVTDAEGNLLTAGEDYEVSYSTDDRTNVTGIITVTITGKGNYSGTITREYQITPLAINVYIENQTKVEGEADPTFTFNYEGVLEGESMGWTGAFVRDAGEAAGTYNVAQGGFVLADNEAGNFLASNYTLTVHPGTLTITAAPVPPGPDDPDPVTPVTPLPTPDPTPVPTPTPGDPGATETTTTPATEEATEMIDDEATPLTAPEPIDDDGTPLASGAHRDCWVHWLMLLGILVTVVYYGGVGVRRVRFSSSLQSFEDDVLGNDETNR